MELASTEAEFWTTYTNNNADPQLHSVVMFTTQPQALNHLYIPISSVPGLCAIKGHLTNGQ